MAEGWTRAETRRRHRWCEGRGYGSGGIPVCGGRAVFFSEVHGEQRCQKCLGRYGKPPSSKEHVLNEGADHVSWCPACAENVERGLNPDGSRKSSPLGQPIVCGDHGEHPWKGHIACSRCGRGYQTQDPTKPRYAPYVCECQARLAPGDPQGRDFSARPICDLCFNLLSLFSGIRRSVEPT